MFDLCVGFPIFWWQFFSKVVFSVEFINYLTHVRRIKFMVKRHTLVQNVI